MKRISPALVVACTLLLASPAAFSETLTYRGTNRWVAQDDAAPLRKLTAAAAKGTRHFDVRLPEQQRPLSVERLEILRHLLEKSAKSGIILEEIDGPATSAGTLWVEPAGN